MIGSQLRAKWLAGEFHAIVSISVPHHAIDLGRLPLSIEEQHRVRRFRQVMDCNRSAMGWFVLRSVVAAMLNLGPEDVNVIRAWAGKPSVHRGPGISISHTGDLAVVAFSSELNIGVDIERIPQDTALSPIIMNTLSPLELMYLPRNRATESEYLLRAWTRKEAVAKVFGSGLTIDLTRLSVADQRGRRFRCHVADQKLVTGIDLVIGSGYVGALASKASINDVTRFHVGRL